MQHILRGYCGYLVIGEKATGQLNPFGFLPTQEGKTNKPTEFKL